MIKASALDKALINESQEDPYSPVAIVEEEPAEPSQSAQYPQLEMFSSDG